MNPEKPSNPPEKSEREALLDELSEIDKFLKEWGPLYNRLVEKGDSTRKEAKHLYETGVADDVNLEMFRQIIEDGRNIESVKSEYIQKMNRKFEIEARLKEMGELN